MALCRANTGDHNGFALRQNAVVTASTGQVAGLDNAIHSGKKAIVRLTHVRQVWQDPYGDDLTCLSKRGGRSRQFDPASRW